MINIIKMIIKLKKDSLITFLFPKWSSEPIGKYYT